MDIEIEDQYSSDEIEDYIDDIKGEDYDVVVSPSDWTVETILNLVKKGSININPKFQRREAWKDDRKSYFIESVLLGLPIPQIILAELDHKYIVVDGRQRLLALLQFTSDNSVFHKLKLKNLTKLSVLNGYSYEDLKNDITLSKYTEIFDNMTIRTIVLKKWKEVVLYDMFLRINQGSVSLSPQELRQALLPGNFTDFIQDSSADNTHLHEILKNSGPDPRMRDAELLLRFYAVKNFLNTDYKGNLKKLLDKTCSNYNKQWEEKKSIVFKQLEEFNESYEFIKNIFENSNIKLFSKIEEHSQRKDFNRAIYDFLMFFFSKQEIRESLKAIPNYREQILKSYRELFNNSDFLDSVSHTTKSISAFKIRFDAWATKLSDILKRQVTSPL